MSVESEQRLSWLKNLLNNMRVAVLLEDAQRRVVFVNQLYCDFFRIALNPAVLKDYAGDKLVHETMLLFSDPNRFVEQYNSTIEKESPVSQQLLSMQDGRWLVRDFVPIIDEFGQINGHFWMYQDVTDMHLLRQALADERDLAQVTLSSIGDGVITTNGRGIITFINPEATRVIGWTQAQAVGQAVEGVFKATNEALDGVQFNLVKQVLATGKKVETSTSTLLCHQTLNKKIPIENSVAPILDRFGQIIGAVLVFRDVSEKHELECSLRWQATHDSLTNLINRQEFERLLHQAQSSSREYALLYLDLDQFKLVNDTAGHLVGDTLLHNIADLFRQQIDNAYILARMGGDEFAVLVEGDSAVAMLVAERLRGTLTYYQHRHLDKIYQISVSIGVVPDIGRQSDTHMLMAMADTACYAAKNAGRDQIWLYQDRDAYLISQQAEMDLVSDLHTARPLHEQALSDIPHPKVKKSVLIYIFIFHSITRFYCLKQ